MPYWWGINKASNIYYLHNPNEYLQYLSVCIGKQAVRQKKEEIYRRLERFMIAD
jgi:hypothetical protein